MNIDIDGVTIGQARRIASLFSSADQSQSGTTDSFCSDDIGRYVIVRSRNEGINAGTLIHARDRCVILADARRIWWHKPADLKQSWYEGVANSGLSTDSKVSPPVEKKVIVEDYSITVCSSVAEQSIKAAKNHVG